MIVNLHQENLDLIFGGLPEVKLEDHEVCVSYIYAKLTKPIKYGLVTLSSTLVDKDPKNPKQELASFFTCSWFDTSDYIISYQPTQLVWYKMQCRHIGDSFFQLHLEEQPETENIKNREKTKIEKIYIQLQFRKICKDSVRH